MLHYSRLALDYLISLSSRNKLYMENRNHILVLAFIAILIAPEILLPKIPDAKNIADTLLRNELRSDDSGSRQEQIIVRNLPSRDLSQAQYMAVSYGAFRKWQAPGKVLPTEKQITQDLKIIQRYWKWIRLYSADETTHLVLEVIRKNKLNIKVMLGVWLEGEENIERKEANITQMKNGITLANQYSGIVIALCVGNETQVYWSGHKLDTGRLIHYIRTARKYTKQPVTTADDYNFWLTPASNRVGDEIDFITLHMYPLWNGISLDSSITWLSSTYSKAAEMHKEKFMLVGETGWATCYNPEKVGTGEQGSLIKAPVGESAQAQFVVNLYTWAKDKKITTFLFEAFDEPWKGGAEAIDIEKHWGVFTEERKPKMSFIQVIKEYYSKKHKTNYTTNIQSTK